MIENGRDAFVDLSYLAAAILFIVGLKMLSSPATARRGNQFAAVGMALAVLATFVAPGLDNIPLIVVGIVLLGAMLVLGAADTWWLRTIGFVAVVLGAANVVGGFVVTDRMLEMFRKKPTAGQGSGAGAKR